MLSRHFSISLRSSKDEDMKNLKARVNLIEQHFHEMAELTDKYAKTTDKLGNKGRGLSEAVESSFEELEQPNIAVHFTKFAKCFLSVQQSRNSLAKNVSSQVASELRVYQTTCHELNREIKECENMMHTQKSEETNLEKMKDRVPVDRRRFVEAQLRVEKAKHTASHSKKILQKQIAKFEKDKTQGSGKILSEFLRIEMQFHARALQTYTKAYRHLMKIPKEENKNHEEKAEIESDSNEELRGDSEQEKSSSGSRLSVSHLF